MISGWGVLILIEFEVVLLVGEGFSNKEIGVCLFILLWIVYFYLIYVYIKFGLFFCF